ncbi:MAG: hypothetical protein ACTFAL_05650 [Candidatus Electronema sp. V4]|uniref:hypothetical protein n=1 Tax=Candidatus Electronema sp. V4 TaxID=3454756 RepID=UPI00405590CC
MLRRSFSLQAARKPSLYHNLLFPPQTGPQFAIVITSLRSFGPLPEKALEEEPVQEKNLSNEMHC